MHCFVLLHFLLSLGRCLLIPKYFCAVYDYAGKQILARDIEIQKENWGTNILKSSKIQSNVCSIPTFRRPQSSNSIPVYSLKPICYLSCYSIVCYWQELWCWNPINDFPGCWNYRPICGLAGKLLNSFYHKYLFKYFFNDVERCRLSGMVK